MSSRPVPLLLRLVVLLAGAVLCNTSARAELLVVSRATGSVLMYDEASGAYIGEFVEAGSGGLVWPVGMRRGPDGHMYVSDQATSRILRYNGATGKFIDTFVPGTQLSEPTDMRFDGQGNLLVANFGSGSVTRYNATTGAFVDTFASANFGVFSSLLFGPDDNLYVGDFGNNVVHRFDGETGSSLGTLSHFSLQGPGGMTLGPDNMLYVSSIFNSHVLRFNPASGAYIDTVYIGNPILDFISGLMFDRDGKLLITTMGSNTVLRVDVGGGPASLAVSGGDLELPVQTLLLTPGDANGDGLVDGADYVIWASNFQGAGTPATGDFNGDGVVDGADYVVWASRFGSTSAAAVSAAIPVPEPSSLALSLAALLSLAAMVRRAR